MAISANDPGMVDAFPVKRGRGRPPTGKAMSGAERVRLHRERRKAAGNFVSTAGVTGIEFGEWVQLTKTLRDRVGHLEVENSHLSAERTVLWSEIERLSSEHRVSMDHWKGEMDVLRSAALTYFRKSWELVPTVGPVKRAAALEMQGYLCTLGNWSIPD